MPEYRRRRQAGGWYFFTVNLQNRNSDLLTRHIDLLRQAMAWVTAERPITWDATVILPEHLHCIWKLPINDVDFSTRWRLIKGRFTQSLALKAHPLTSTGHRGERGIWQSRYWEHVLRDEEDYCRHVDYIHFNPVKHGYVARPLDWPYSSIHKFIQTGRLEKNWGECDQVIKDLDVE